MTILMTPVKSSAMEAHGYNPTTRVLTVKTKTATYRYANVPPETAAEFAGSESLGRAWGSLIRGQFDIVPDEPQKETQQ